MSREKDQPKGRFSRIVAPTPHQMKYRLSAFERHMGQEIHWWHRGLMFTWIWEDLEREWHWYEQTWFFRGTREWWLLYVPYFWRNGMEFFQFEDRFIREANTKHGRISERDFINQARKVKRDLNLGAIQGPLLGAVSAGAGATAVAANGLSKIGDISNYQDMMKCWMDEKKYEEACARVVAGWLTKGAQLKLAQ